MVVLLAALAGGITAGAVLGSGSGSPSDGPAAVITGHGPSVVHTNPVSVKSGDLVDPANIITITERQGVILDALLHVDLLGGPGNSVPPMLNNSGDIPTGTAVDSQFLHFQGNERLTGEVTFATDILGVIYLTPNPPKDTNGRREGSGRGWVRELQGRWPGVLG